MKLNSSSFFALLGMLILSPALANDKVPTSCKNGSASDGKAGSTSIEGLVKAMGQKNENPVLQEKFEAFNRCVGHQRDFIAAQNMMLDQIMKKAYQDMPRKKSIFYSGIDGLLRSYGESLDATIAVVSSIPYGKLTPFSTGDLKDPSKCITDTCKESALRARHWLAERLKNHLSKRKGQGDEILKASQACAPENRDALQQRLLSYAEEQRKFYQGEQLTSREKMATNNQFGHTGNDWIDSKLIPSMDEARALLSQKKVPTCDSFADAFRTELASSSPAH